ncbi:MAG: L-aspartate oxidase [Candidatus Coatesbacteria bacterium RBG_13_66_14]|uniref:L-aspartate oxidase n=1 Tax=Candidatus Coatesbacteria bacterium RBG_13_66_14 TaxID=1817816 RepID=A0A1F5FGR0_9BACT|nr:MAG: L-aspartate oxidase [Candidatus Coatesbacteria bacterium RBG_13_66_14]
MKIRDCDFLVIGSGIAGLSIAVRSASLGSVVVLTKKEAAESNTNLAQGGIAAVIAPGDSFDQHVADTLRAGVGLCHRDAVELMVRQGPERVRELAELGAGFTRNPEGDFELGREGGHSSRRIVHASDLTGYEIEKALLAAARKRGVEIVTNSLAYDLTLAPGPDGLNQCTGVAAVEGDEVVLYRARAVFLCTGGAGKVYLYTSNPDVATGDGMALALRAGCRMANMEFVQFHPTCLYHPLERSFLITEALRGEGARLLTTDGRRFMPDYDERAELAPRDIVARAIDSEMKTSGEKHVLLDATVIGAQKLKKRFPNVYGRCLELGYDIAQKPFPVVPAAHYFCGGVLTDLRGRTDLPRLYAVGECACTGVHGANRLASNSLLEAVVFAHEAADDLPRWMEELGPPPVDAPPAEIPQVRPPTEMVTLDHDWDNVRRLTWDYVGIVRSDRRLRLAADRLRLIARSVEDTFRRGFCADLIELRNITQVARMIVQSALERRESRGLHYNRDCPETDDAHWAKDTVLTQFG